MFIPRRLEYGIAGIDKALINAYYPHKFRAKESEFGTGNTEDEEIIVSLTSFPARIDVVPNVIKSILLQSLKPDKIVLYLGEDEFEDVALPKELTSLEKYGLEIRFRKDLKPHTKYFYAMQEFPNANIITVDDDIYYRPNLISALYAAHKEDRDKVICTRAHKITFNGSEFRLYNEWDYETRDISYPSHLLLACGVGGVLYPPSCLCKETFDDELLSRLTLKADDLWLKIMELKSDVKVRAISAYKSTYLVGINNAEEVALYKDNVGENRNDVYWRNLTTHFGITKDDFVSC